jgi:hypothetical protein
VVLAGVRSSVAAPTLAVDEALRASGFCEV